MRALFTGDFQTDWSNIDKCEIIWKFILELCKKYALEAIVLTGDLKAAYNPVDMRVTKFWDKAISKARENDIRVIILLGNHDRIGLYTDSKNWLSVLKRFGAEVFDKPGVCELHDGKIAMLPFTTSVTKLRQRSDELAQLHWNQNKDILLFHADIKNCKYNQLGTKSNGRLNVNELHPEKYAWCIGGHIHLPQYIEPNVYYVGSPFIQDWGEVNQRKSFIIVTPNSLGDSRIKFVDSPIPGWYDKDWPGYTAPKDWKGCYLRVHQKVSYDKSYGKVIDRAKEIALREHPGAIVKIVPEFDEKEKQVIKVDASSSDEKKIEQYIRETIPDELDKNKVLSFLVNKLKSVKGLKRSGSTIKFLTFKGKNVLSFKDIECNFRHQGITVIEGLNKDWDNQSNGTGKSNYANVIPVSLFGTTFKGQKFDKWARRNTKNKAIAKLEFKNENGKKLTIIRGRRPNKIQLLVDGSDISSGLNKSTEDGTQAHIEHFTGFTWQTLANSIYIDKTLANAFLTGRKSDRVDLLYKFQNLERFTKALKLVKLYKDKHYQSIEQNEKAIDILRTKRHELKKYLKEAKKESKQDLHKLQNDYIICKMKWKELHTIQNQLENKVRKVQYKYQKKYDKAIKQVALFDKSIEQLEAPMWKTEQQINQYKESLNRGQCPVCGKKFNPKRYKQKLKEATKLAKNAKQTIDELKSKRQKANEQCAIYEGEIDKAKIDFVEVKSKADREKDKLMWIKQQIAESKWKNNSSIKVKEKQLLKLKKELKEYKHYANSLEEDKQFIQYCEDAFNKDGIPAFLNAQLAPILNRAAEEYSDKFCDKEILIQFEVVDGDLVPTIINAHGGDEKNDQSKGEGTMAGLITSFALKEIAPKANILILDEPEEGLSPQNIKRFASELQKMKDKWESIFVVSHSPILLGELANERVIKIEKHHGVSRVV